MMSVDIVEELGPFETMAAAKYQYRFFAYKSQGIPTSWEVYVSAFKAGAAWMAHSSGRLSDPETRLAIRTIAAVLGLESAVPEPAQDSPGFRDGAAWMGHTSSALSDPEFRLAIRALAEILVIETGGQGSACKHCGALP